MKEKQFKVNLEFNPLVDIFNCFPKTKKNLGPGNVFAMRPLSLKGTSRRYIDSWRNYTAGHNNPGDSWCTSITTT